MERHISLIRKSTMMKGGPIGIPLGPVLADLVLQPPQQIIKISHILNSLLYKQLAYFECR